MRINSSQLAPPAHRGKEIQIHVDGEPIIAYQGETVAAALIASSRFIFRRTAGSGSPRGLYCGIGLCYECRMIINGVPNRRACAILVEADMRVQSQDDRRIGG